jgi:hypothetical protein
LKELTSIEGIIFKLYEQDVYLLHISETWQTEDKQNSLKHVRYFKYLMEIQTIQNNNKSDQQTPKNAFIVIDYDLHHVDLEHDNDRAETCFIYYPKHGIIESKDYYQYSHSENSFLYF